MASSIGQPAQGQTKYQPSELPLQTIVTTQPIPIQTNPSPLFREVPVQVKCIHCRAEVVTSVEYETGMLTWVSCFFIILFGWAFPLIWFGFCFIPFCIKYSKDVVHKCPNCKMVVGRHNRLA